MRRYKPFPAEFIIAGLGAGLATAGLFIGLAIPIIGAPIAIVFAVVGYPIAWFFWWRFRSLERSWARLLKAGNCPRCMGPVSQTTHDNNPAFVCDHCRDVFSVEEKNSVSQNARLYQRLQDRSA